MVELYVVMALIFGGAMGLSYKEKENIELRKKATTSSEPEQWGPEFHRKFLRECSKQCRQSKSLFKSYDPLSGKCSCTRRGK
jgi:hypothetical protein